MEDMLLKRLADKYLCRYKGDPELEIRLSLPPLITDQTVYLATCQKKFIYASLRRGYTHF